MTGSSIIIHILESFPFFILKTSCNPGPHSTFLPVLVLFFASSFSPLTLTTFNALTSPLIVFYFFHMNSLLWMKMSLKPFEDHLLCLFSFVIKSTLLFAVYERECHHHVVQIDPKLLGKSVLLLNLTSKNYSACITIPG